MANMTKWNTSRTEEYQAYSKALCRLASGYVSSIRILFATQAFEKYEDPTIRRLVLEYGKECEKLDRQRLRDFENYALLDDDEYHSECLEDSCLNNARHYEEAIKLLFGIYDR